MDVRSITRPNVDPAAAIVSEASRACLHMQIHMILRLQVSRCVTSYQHRLMIPENENVFFVV